MNRGKGGVTYGRIGGQHGYTIVEVLIFLAVSAVLFGSTMTLLSGRQQRVQFTNAVRDFETKIIDVANDVSNGYYQSAGDISCNASLNISVGGMQGTNEPCIMLGRIFKLGLDTDTERYSIYSIVGKRTHGGKDVVNISDATPALLLTGNASNDQSLREQLGFGSGATVRCIGFNKNNCNVPSEGSSNAAIAFVTKLNGEAGVGADGNGITSDIYRVQSASIDEPEPTFIPKVNSTNLIKVLANETMTICVQSGGTNQYALVRILNGRVMSEIKEVSGGALCS